MRTRTDRGRILRRGAPPLCAAVLLGALGHLPPAGVLFAASIAIVALGAFSPRTGEALDHVLARVGGGAGRAVGLTLSYVAFMLVVLPSWLLTRLLGSDPLGRTTTGPSGWRAPAPVRGGAARVEARRAGSSQLHRARPRPVRAALARALGVTALVATVLAATATATGRPIGWPLRADGGPDRTATSAVPAPKHDPLPAAPVAAAEFNDLPVDSYAHEDEPWAPQLFGELQQIPYMPDPFLGSRYADMEGRHVNIVDGRRVSWTPADPELTVWFFGGSTMFGIGQRDDHTIPSVVAKTAADGGVRLRALNFGVSGYVNWQSVELLEQALTSELPRPDLIVFYDGVNDWGLAMQHAQVGETRPGVIGRLALGEDELEDAKEAAGGEDPAPIGPETLGAAGQLVADQYRRGTEIARSLARRVGVPVAFAWQPSPFAKRATPVDDPLWERIDFDPALLPMTTGLYRSIVERSGVPVLDLSTALDGVDEPVYFDGSHTNELGARLVGEALYERIAARLTRLSSGP